MLLCNFPPFDASLLFQSSVCLVNVRERFERLTQPAIYDNPYYSSAVTLCTEIMNSKSVLRKQSVSRPHDRRETVLLAVTGMTPAIITETVWGLAHESSPTVPDRVVVVTTTTGRNCIQQELFTARPEFGNMTVWEQLRKELEKHGVDVANKLRFGTTPDDIRVFTVTDVHVQSIELDDIRTPAENEAAADFLLDTLRVFTENPDIRLICSLAGGRKTMSALLYSCVSLIGRDDDRLTHVLVNEPFTDSRLKPRFYFPSDQLQMLQGEGKPNLLSATRARVELADVPFVPMRKLLPRVPGRFTDLVNTYRSKINALSSPPRVELSEKEPLLTVEGQTVALTATEFALMSFLVERARAGQAAYQNYKDALDPFESFLKTWTPVNEPESFRHDAIRTLRGATDQTLRQLVLRIKQKLTEQRLAPVWVSSLVPRRHCFGVNIAMSKGKRHRP